VSLTINNVFETTYTYATLLLTVLLAHCDRVYVTWYRIDVCYEGYRQCESEHITGVHHDEQCL